MRKNVTSPEAREEIVACIKTVFGELLSSENTEEWYQMLLGEVKSWCEGDYSICQRRGGVCFSQCGKKEFYHDGSEQYCKSVCVEAIGEEEYCLAKRGACAKPYEFHNYSDAWMARGSERFLVTMPGRSFDYYYFAKDLAGIPYVKIVIEEGY